MKIAADAVNFSASHSASSSHTIRETLRAWTGDKRPDFEAMEKGLNPAQSSASIATISAEARRAAEAAATTPQQSGEAQAIEDSADAVEHDPMLSLLKAVVEMLTGHRIKLTTSADFNPDQAPPEITAPESPSQQATQSPRRAGFGIEYDRHEVVDEAEQTNIQVEGKVRTSDGKEIDFKLALAMSRQFHEESNVSIRAGDGVKKDPLVINFDGSAAQLQSQRFKFDLDGDGKAENVPLLSGNRGYLALDLNGNGKIDSGQELFGARSGDGFSELSKYDGDGNGWIDENDAAFSKLQVWSPTADGKDSLSSLAEHGVGALYLGNVAAPFALKDNANQTLGAVRASGLYLTEKGSAGSIQQIDLMV